MVHERASPVAVDGDGGGAEALLEGQDGLGARAIVTLDLLRLELGLGSVLGLGLGFGLVH